MLILLPREVLIRVHLRIIFLIFNVFPHHILHHLHLYIVGVVLLDTSTTVAKGASGLLLHLQWSCVLTYWEMLVRV